MKGATVHYEIGGKNYKVTSSGLYDTTLECMDCSFRFNYSVDKASKENEKEAEHVCIIQIEENGK